MHISYNKKFSPGHFHSNYHNRFNQYPRNYNPNSYTRHRHPNHSNHYSVAEFIGRQMAVETHKVRGIVPTTLLDHSEMPELSTTDSMPQICTGKYKNTVYWSDCDCLFSFSILLIPNGPTILTFSNPSGISNFNF